MLGAVALLLGGIPPALFLVRVSGLYGLVSALLTLSWIISGLASGYLVYRWNKAGRLLFGAKKILDSYAFWVSVASGLNLGVTGVFGQNIGMSINSNRIIFTIVAILYLLSAAYLYKRWARNGQKIF